MLIKGATREQIDAALELTNRLFEGNVQYSTIALVGNTRQGEPKHTVTLRVEDCHKAGARLGFHVTSKGNRRHLPNACWHAHGVFFDSLPEGTEIQVGSKVQDTRTGKYRKLVTYPNAKWWDFEVGSHFEPVLLSRLCECGKDDWNGGWPESYREVECSECGEKKPKRQMTELEVYDHPFDDEPRTVHICDDIAGEYSGGYNHCFERLFDHSWGDFRYFTCDDCQRVVCEQNPSNGWMTQYRIVDDEQVCLRCYERRILENGIPREQFAENRIGGMFFSGDNREPLDAGYECVLHDVKIPSSEWSPEGFCQEAMKLIDSGHKVVVGYESMGIGGSEGYVSLFAKMDERLELQERVMEKMLESPLVSELDLRGM